MDFVVLLVWPRLRCLVVGRLRISRKTRLMMSQVDISSSLAPFLVAAGRNQHLMPPMSVAFKKKVPPACTDKFIISEVCDEEEAASQKQDMKARFEDWMKKYGKTYRDEEEKAMRFQLFKKSVEWHESQPPSAQKKMEINFLADFTDEEHPVRRSGLNLYGEEYREHIKELRAKQARGLLSCNLFIVKYMHDALTSLNHV